MSDRNLLVTVFSDASMAGPEVGCGWWFKSSESTSEGSDRMTREGVNIGEAELWGISLALAAAAKAHSGNIDVVIQCDNLGALQALFTKGYQWAKTSQMKVRTPRRLSSFEESLTADIRAIPNLKHIYLKHVKGHSGKGNPRSYVNTITDKLASQARKATRGKEAA